MAAGASRLLGRCKGLRSADRLPSSSSSSTTCSLPLVTSPSDGGKQREGEEKNKLMGISMLTACQLQQRNLKLEAGPGSYAAAPAASSVTQLATNAHKLILTTTQLPTVSPGMVKDVYYSWKSLQAEILIEKGMIRSQSFTLIAVAGSLIGSILCFIEGCFLVLKSFLLYFQTISQKVDQGGIIQLLIEALDMFLVGTALLTFGMGLYVMFSAPNKMKQPTSMNITTSNLFGLFNLQRLSDSMGMHSISQAKSKFGHALVLIIQTGVMEKVKNVSLTTSFDLACFAAAVLISAASVFLLSKLTVMVPQSKHS